MQTTTEVIEYWNAFSPYMDYLENALGINSDNLDLVIPLIQSPVLVVGAGQGLLVSELMGKGFTVEGIDYSPEMVAAAEKRRGIKLVLGNADQMPFEKGRFKTTIVATGVIDFTDDPSQIGAIINEVKRVTDAQGKILVALMGLTPQTEALARYIGYLTDNQFNTKWWAQIMLGSKPPLGQIIAIIWKDPDKCIPGFLFHLFRALMSMRKRTGTRIKAIKKLKAEVKQGRIKDPKILIDYVPERMFFRNSKQIDELFTSLSSPPRSTYVFDNCTIVQL